MAPRGEKKEQGLVLLWVLVPSFPAPSVKMAENRGEERERGRVSLGEREEGRERERDPISGC